MRGAYSRYNAALFALTFAVILLGALVFRLISEKRSVEKQQISQSRREIMDSADDQKLQKFSLKGFDDQGKEFWNLEGETAKIDPGQTIFLDQNVTFKLQDNTLIRTDHVKWSPDGGTVTTNEPVFVDHQNVKIKGVGALGRPKDSFVQLNRDIEMVINEKTTLSCKGPMKIYYKENKLIFYRKVVIVDERGKLSSNRMDVFFDPIDKKVKQVIAVGNVVVERGMDTTRSQRAIYTVATGAVRLEGNPEITLHKDSKILDAPFRN